MEKIVQVIITDALELPTGFLAPAPYRCFIYCRVPSDWTQDGKLKDEKYDVFYETMYGANWQNGNDDGSRYVVSRVESRVLTPEEETDAPWLKTVNDKEFHYWFYKAENGSGELQNVAPENF